MNILFFIGDAKLRTLLKRHGFEQSRSRADEACDFWQIHMGLGRMTQIAPSVGS